jgi:hypothetical protein
VPQAELRGERGVQLQRHAQRDDAVDLGAEERPGQAVLRDAEAHHAAGLGGGLEHGDVVVQQGQVVRGGHARCPAPMMATLRFGQVQRNRRGR